MWAKLYVHTLLMRLHIGATSVESSMETPEVDSFHRAKFSSISEQPPQVGAFLHRTKLQFPEPGQ